MFLGLELYYNAWFELDTERSYGDIPEPIKRSSIFEYAKDYDLGEDQTEDLLFFIRQMDNSHLTRIRSKKKPPPKGKRARD